MKPQRLKWSSIVMAALAVSLAAQEASVSETAKLTKMTARFAPLYGRGRFDPVGRSAEGRKKLGRRP